MFCLLLLHELSTFSPSFIVNHIKIVAKVVSTNFLFNESRDTKNFTTNKVVRYY